MNTEQIIKGMKIGDVQFYVNKVRHKFRVLNNMPDTHGLSLNDAVDNWVHRTDDFSAQSFCDYVNSKGTGFICCLPTKRNIKKYLRYTTQQPSNK